MVGSQTIVTGLTIGSYIAIAAVGFTLLYGIIDMLNFAYAEYMTIGAYVGFVLVSFTGFEVSNIFSLEMILLLLIVLVSSAVIGLVIAKIVFRKVYGSGEVALLLTSLGLGLALRAGIRFFAGSTDRYFPPVEVSSYMIGAIDLRVNSLQVLVIGTSVLVFVLLHILLTRTDTGVAMRAMGDNEELSLVVGLDIKKIRNHVWLLASGLAGIAGLMIVLTRPVSPVTGWQQFLMVFTAAIIGGAGSVYGAILGGYMIGIVLSFSTGLLPSGMTELASSMVFVVLILFLLFRPSGIAGKEVEG